MDKIFEDFKDKGVVIYQVYTREPHAGQKTRAFDFSDKKQTKTHQERVDYALEMIKEYSQKIPALIDTFGPDCIQNTLGGHAPNSLVVIDREGKIAFLQDWSNPKDLRVKLEEITNSKKKI